MHDDEHVPARRRRYLTATPRPITASTDATSQVVSMDDETGYGPVVHRLLFAHAIDLGLLADYRVVVSVVAEPEAPYLICPHPHHAAWRITAGRLETGLPKPRLAAH
ncbi:hypothetical protein OHQ88_33675 (plasmid) [Micromonospora zamorensis]|uniref:hypothetical protein n=1 Tax=Micromonospora zamorensis TaxID=709883 RepID=UPI002E1D1807